MVTDSSGKKATSGFLKAVHVVRLSNRQVLKSSMTGCSYSASPELESYAAKHDSLMSYPDGPLPSSALVCESVSPFVAVILWCLTGRVASAGVT